MAKRRNKNYGRLIAKMAVALFVVTVIGVGVLGAIVYTSNHQDETPETADVMGVSNSLEVSLLQNKKAEIVETDTIYDNIFIENVNVGGLTKADAKQKLEDELQKPINEKKITLSHESLQWDIKYSQLNAKYAIDKAVENAYKIAREGTDEERLDKIEQLKTTPVKLNADYTIDASLAEPIVAEIAPQVDVAAVDATIKRENNNFVTTPEKSGIRLNVTQTYEKVSQLANSGSEGTVSLVMEEAAPKYVEEDLKKVGDVIGSYSTKFSLSAVDRNVNLQVASKNINNTFLYPGDVFSTGKAFGPTTAEFGYKEATIILNGKFTTDYGGGVCQVSSTLYNAVLFAELDIVQRQNHSKQVTYVPIGRDATLAGDIIDFKFENSTKYPIYIESFINKDKVVVNIYGVEERPSNRTFDFESEVTERINPPAEQIIEDPTLYVGERKVELESKIGQKVKVYKKIFVDGKLVDKVQVNNSYYTPTRAEIRVGTKPIDGNYKGEVMLNSDGTPMLNPDGTPVKPSDVDTPIQTDPVTPGETTPTESEPPVVPEPDTVVPEPDPVVPEAEVPATDNTQEAPPPENAGDEGIGDTVNTDGTIFADEN